MVEEGIFFVLVGPSGAGKNTLMQRVKERLPDLSQVPTMTTRDKRENEQEGREHRFVSAERFQKAIKQNELIEYQQVHLSDMYGTPRDVVDQAIALGTDLIADIEFLGAEKLHLAYPRHTVLIFVTPSNLRILADRIVGRADITPKELSGRLDRARFEMTFAPQCHYLIINDDRELAAQELRHIITTERHQRRAQAMAESDRVPPHTIDSCITAIIQRGDQVLLERGQLPRFEVDARGRRLHEAAQERVNATLVLHLPALGPLDIRFDYPAPSAIIVRGASPHFTLDYYYRFAYPDADHAIPGGWQWAPLASVAMPDMLGELVTP